MKIDINLCRVCLENVGVIPFFQDHGGEIVSEMISSLFNINLIFKETLPTRICTNCLENIKLCILTKNIIVNSESLLSAYLKCNILNEQSPAVYLNQIKSESEDCVEIPELIGLEAEEIKIEISDERSQDFEDEQSAGLQIVQVQSLTSFNPQLEHIHEKIHSGTVLGQETKQRYLRTKPKEFPAKQRNPATHLGEKPFLRSFLRKSSNEIVCDVCNRKFASKGNLRCHIRLVHNTDHPKNIKCNICGKISISLYKSKVHLSAHTRNKSFPCKFCSWKFVNSGTLRTHIKEKHLEQEVKPSKQAKPKLNQK